MCIEKCGWLVVTDIAIGVWKERRASPSMVGAETVRGLIAVRIQTAFFFELLLHDIILVVNGVQRVGTYVWVGCTVRRFRK